MTWEEPGQLLHVPQLGVFSSPGTVPELQSDSAGTSRHSIEVEQGFQWLAMFLSEGSHSKMIAAHVRVLAQA